MSDGVVGICAAIERVRWGPWEAEAAMMPITYVDAVLDAGGLALLLPPDDATDAVLDPLLDRIDGVILAGGSDIDPSTYGARSHPRTSEPSPRRDRFELGLARRALEREMPLLGICRGMQLLNVALGGTLLQHVPDVVGHDGHRQVPGAFRDHDVRLEEGSLAARAAGGELVTVRSHHHQGIDELGESLVASGWSVPDELVEAIEITNQPFTLGILWHPEGDERDRVVAAFVAAVRGRAGVR